MLPTRDILLNAETDRVEEIDLRHYWRIVMRHKWGIVGLAFALSLLTGLIVYSMDPVFRATVTILIESRGAKVVSIEEVYSIEGGKSEYYQTQFEILKSRELAVRVVRKLDMVNMPEFDPELRSGLAGLSLSDWLPIESDDVLDEDDKIAKVVDAFRKRVIIAPVRQTQLVNVSFESDDPQLAATVANTLADLFIEGYLESRLQNTQKVTQWLSGRTGTLRSNLEASEQRLQEYREQNQLIDMAGVRTVGAKELEELIGSLVDARRERSIAENIYSDVRNLQGKSAAELMTVPAVLRHPLTQGLSEREAEAERKVAELSRRYGVKHPKMVAAKAELAVASRELSEQVAMVVSGIKRKYDAARRNEKNLMAELNASKSGIQVINRKEFKLRELEREVETNRKLYDMFLTRIKETDESVGMDTAHARVVDPAVAPREPIKPRKGLSIGLAFVISLVLGVLIAFVHDALDNTLKSPVDIEEKLGVPMLGMLPLIKTSKGVGLTEYWQDANSGFAEAIRTIRTGVILSGLDNPHQVTVVTSSVPGEGKSTVSLNMAVALGQMEKTLIIGADLRRPTLANRIGLPPNAAGLAQLVAGTGELEDCVHHWEEGGIYVMPAGIIPSNPLEVLSSRRFVEALVQLKQRYDRIIVDSAPTHAVSDALVLASYADSLIYLVKADSTPFTMVRTGISRLVNSNAPFTGVVLNQVNLEKASKYYDGDHYYYTGYQSTYGYGESGQA